MFLQVQFNTFFQPACCLQTGGWYQTGLDSGFLSLPRLQGEHA